ncbi:hypothetical protein VIGAN_08329200 [Vigna angularis var. angularis]|uniref:Uncharacterized protein n=1 Tax=Vigna angularis var. angularis TaxID=157739 RepID=A0A0S3SU40_PHAAN|nr:hypothetical protein VIGAN_08329200 [Vigna angularis var. angularis]
MSKCKILVLQPLCKYSSPRATPMAILYIVVQFIVSLNLKGSFSSYMNFSRDPLGMYSYMRNLLEPSKQNPSKLTMLT